MDVHQHFTDSRGEPTLTREEKRFYRNRAAQRRRKRPKRVAAPSGEIVRLGKLVFSKTPMVAEPPEVPNHLPAQASERLSLDGTLHRTDQKQTEKTT